ncbi:MAG TPA: hypothetical protein DCS24_06870 [Erythrobacter sp.]|nr:hypothetical protein [Erythrobacter sp.]
MSQAQTVRLRQEHFWRGLFFITIALVIGFACAPALPAGLPLLNDKLLHFGAFAALTVMALLAFRKARAVMVLMGLSGLGLAIELLQAMPFINRSAEGMDWLVDVLAIAFLLVLARAFKYLAAAGR